MPPITDHLITLETEISLFDGPNFTPKHYFLLTVEQFHVTSGAFISFVFYVLFLRKRQKLVVIYKTMDTAALLAQQELVYSHPLHTAFGWGAQEDSSAMTGAVFVSVLDVLGHVHNIRKRAESNTNASRKRIRSSYTQCNIVSVPTRSLKMRQTMKCSIRAPTGFGKSRRNEFLSSSACEGSNGVFNCIKDTRT